MTRIDALLDDLFDGTPPAFEPEFRSWVSGSRRFRAFVTEHSTKIRAKLRNAHADGGLEDVRAELETAALLLREARFTLAYETYAAARQRGPDFTVTFRTHTRFNVEVRRLRGGDLNDGSPQATQTKLAAVLCDKVGQMPPGIMNVLWLAAENALSERQWVETAAGLRQRADDKDEDYFARRGYASAAHFLRQYRHLSGVLLRQPSGGFLWLNALARHPISPDLTATLRRLLAA